MTDILDDFLIIFAIKLKDRNRDRKGLVYKRYVNEICIEKIKAKSYGTS